MSSEKSGCSVTIGFGGIIAAILSWALNHSIWWAILHSFFGGLYILYAVFFRTKEIVPALRAMFGV